MKWPVTSFGWFVALGCFLILVRMWHHQIIRLEVPTDYKSILLTGFAVIVGALIGGHYAVTASKELIRDQRKQKDSDRQHELKLILRSFYQELESSWRLYCQGSGAVIEDRISDGKTIVNLLPISSAYFPVYDANVSKIGLIEDDNLRSQIVDIYTLARALVDAVHFNNRLIDEANKDMRNVNLNAGGTDRQALIEQRDISLNKQETSSKILKTIHGQVKKAFDDLMPLLKTAYS